MTLNEYKNLLNPGVWYTKDPQDAQILDIVGVNQNIIDD